MTLKDILKIMTPEDKDERQEFIDGLAAVMREAGADVTLTENGMIIKITPESDDDKETSE